MKRPFPLLALILLFCAAAWWGWGWYNSSKEEQAKKDAKNQPVVIRVATASRQDVPVEIHEAGSVVAYETVAVRARVDSQIMEANFKDGARVEKGQLLFVLDDRTLRAQLKEREAQLANLRLQYTRAQNLLKSGAVSRARLDEARAAFEAQDAVVNSAKVQLEYTRINAPISGRAGTINVTVGNNVKANDAQPLVTINQVQPIRVQMSLSQRYYDAMRAAMASGPLPVMVKREGVEEKLEGSMEYIDNAVEQASGTFVARAVFANEDEALWPGMFVSVTIHLGEDKNALTIPEEAVQHGQGGEFVYVIAGEKAHKTPVRIVRMADGRALISEGVQEGAQVAIDGMLGLKDGSAVKISEEKKKADEANAESEKTPPAPSP